MQKTIAITGGTGLIGKKIINKLAARGDVVIAITRNIRKAEERLPENVKFIEWDFKSSSPSLISALSVSDAVIHLAGENVLSKRWTDEHKNNIYNSRVNSTKLISDTVLQSGTKPGLFISASAIGYYGLFSELPVDEDSKCGTDFLALLTRDWENASSELTARGIRTVKIRTGIVLDKNEGALAKMLLPFKMFAGGALGNGKQFFPWIHVDDEVDLFIYALDNSTMHGVYNAVAPESIIMKNFCTVLGNKMNRPSFLNVPAFALKIMYGQGAEILLNGVNVIPKRTLESGFKFSFASVKEALDNIL